jgi:hypothetical protein
MWWFFRYTTVAAAAGKARDGRRAAVRALGRARIGV